MMSRDIAGGITLLLACLVAPSSAGAQTAPAPSHKVDGEHRFLMRFAEDAAVVPSYWLEGQIWFQSNRPPYEQAFDDLTPSEREAAGEADYLGVSPIFAINVAEDLEFGGRISLARRDPDAASTETGLTDLDLWGKISLVSDPVKISLGLLLSIPTGNRDRLLGSGETNVEFFGGIRKDFEHLTVAGHVGVRINQDQDFRGGQAEGKNSLLVGAGLLFPAGEKIVLSAEWAYETERLDGLRSDSRLMGGLDYRLNENFLLRGGAGGGLARGAPDFLATGGIVWLF
jgi:hypothetical protein